MAVTINGSGADTYFAENSHVCHAMWDAFDSTLRDAAIAQAVRILSRTLGSDLTDQTADSTASYQPANAAYEQALHVLVMSDAVPNGEFTAAKWISDMRERGAQDPNEICQEARRWMDWQSGNVIAIAKG